MTFTCDCGKPARLVGEGEGTTVGYLPAGDGHDHDGNCYSGDLRCPDGHLVSSGGQKFSKPCPECGWRKKSCLSCGELLPLVIA